MASEIKRGESLFIPFKNEKSIYDSQCKPRMYKTQKAYEKSFPGYRFDVDCVELVEYAEVVRGRWMEATHPMQKQCSVCKSFIVNLSTKKEHEYSYCPNCGAKMDGDGDGTAQV